MSHDSHDEIHMPPPSFAPIVVAAGMTLTLMGLLNTLLLIIGAVILAVGVGMWAFTTYE